ncbi:MAG: BatA domain-containing protein [Bacteroidia bacterium]|nr:BatA domain-containing protein [Bacteroidia bacterium]
MAFLFPGFLFALLALSVPILVHLFNFRRYKTVLFTNVRFLKEVKKDTQSKNRLKYLLILASRLIALAALIFAFAQPYLAAEEGHVPAGQRALSVYLDNSFSMDALGRNGTLLEDARNKAREIASTFSNSDLFQLVTNDFEGKHQRLVNKEEFLELLEEVQLSPAARDLNSVLTRQKDALAGAGTLQKAVYLLSDFQRSISNLGSVPADTSVRIHLVPLESNSVSNVYVDSVWFPTPVRQKNRSERVFLRIRNFSLNLLENIPVKLFINGQQRAPGSFSLEPGAAGEYFLSFVCKESGIQNCRVEIQDHPLTFDDAFYFSFTLRNTIPVLAIHEQSADSTVKSLRAVYSDSLFRYLEADAKSIDYSSFPRYALIVLNGLKSISSGLSSELKKFTDGGGSVFLIPGTEIDLPSYKNFLQPLSCPFPESTDTSRIKTGKLFYEHPLFENVFDKKPENPDLPVVTRRYTFSRAVRSTEEPLLQLQNGESFLSVIPIGNGRLYLSAVALHPSWSNFTRHALFVPVFFQSALHATPAEKLYYTIGKGEGIEHISTGAGGEKIFHLKGPDQSDLIPETRSEGNFSTVYPGNLVRKAGNYSLYSGDSVLSGISYNYDRRESDPGCFTAEELKEMISSGDLKNIRVIEAGEKNLAEIIRIAEQGTPLWKWFIALCLLFLGTEVCLIRFMK